MMFIPPEAQFPDQSGKSTIKLGKLIYASPLASQAHRSSGVILSLQNIRLGRRIIPALNCLRASNWTNQDDRKTWQGPLLVFLWFSSPYYCWFDCCICILRLRRDRFIYGSLRYWRTHLVTWQGVPIRSSRRVI